jgi:hypothetical protein
MSKKSRAKITVIAILIVLFLAASTLAILFFQGVLKLHPETIDTLVSSATEPEPPVDDTDLSVLFDGINSKGLYPPDKGLKVAGILPNGEKAYDINIADVYPEIEAYSIAEDGSVAFVAVTEYHIQTEDVGGILVNLTERYKGALIKLDKNGIEQWRYPLTQNTDFVEDLTIAPNGDIYTVGVHHPTQGVADQTSVEGWQWINTGGSDNELAIKRFSPQGELLSSKLIPPPEDSDFDMWSIDALYAEGKLLLLNGANNAQRKPSYLGAYNDNLEQQWAVALPFDTKPVHDGDLTCYNGRIMVCGAYEYAYYSLEGNLEAKYDHKEISNNFITFDDTVVLLNRPYESQEETVLLLLYKNGVQKTIASYSSANEPYLYPPLNDGSFFVGESNKAGAPDYYDRNGDIISDCKTIKLPNGAYYNIQWGFYYQLPLINR